MNLYPREEESYYLDRLRKEICKAIESNPMNIGGINSLKLVVLYQDRIENPYQYNKNGIVEESAFYNNTTKCSIKGKGMNKSQSTKKSSTSS